MKIDLERQQQLYNQLLSRNRHNKTAIKSYLRRANKFCLKEKVNFLKRPSFFGSKDKENFNSPTQSVLSGKVDNKTSETSLKNEMSECRPKEKGWRIHFLTKKQISQNLRHSDETRAPIHLKSLELEIKTTKHTKTAAQRRIFQRVMPLMLLQPDKFQPQQPVPARSSQKKYFYLFQ